MGDIKRMRLRRADVCRCGTAVAQGEMAGWDRQERVVVCEPCLGIMESLADVIDPGVPGASLQREYERRTAVRETRVKNRFPRMGRALLRLAGPVHTTEAFAKGAEGEREVARLLDAKLGDDALFLYNRRLGVGQRYGDIDLIVIVRSGVYVVDPKNYRGRRVRANRSRDTFIVDGRKRTSLTTSMRKQLDAVENALRDRDVAVEAAYCFLGADLPWRTLRVDCVRALSPRRVVKLLKQPGPYGPERRAELHSYLHAKFPAA